MANIVTLTATDGSSVEFYDEIKASGGVKDVYFSTDGTYVVAFYRKALSPNDRQRIDDIVNTHRQLIFTTDEVGKYWTTLFAWPTKIVMWGEKVGLVMPFYDKKFFFSGVDPTWRLHQKWTGEERKVVFGGQTGQSLRACQSKRHLSHSFAHVLANRPCHAAPSCRGTCAFRLVVQQCLGRSRRRQCLHHRLRWFGCPPRSSPPKSLVLPAS